MTSVSRIILVIIILIFVSCKPKFTSPELENHFTSIQISDLETITDFFNKQISQNGEESDFKTCFEEMLPKLVEDGWLPILESIDFEQQKEMYSSISATTFNKIWGFGKTWKFGDEVAYRSVGVANSKYILFLRDVGKNYQYIKEYVDGIESRGGIADMGSLQLHIYLNPNNLNLDDPNIQIIIAVHFLTMNDSQKRVEKWSEE